jgi:hypothetical protein
VYQRRWGGCIFIQLGEFPTMEHLLAMRVSVPATPCSVGLATVIFLYRFLTLTRGLDTIFSELKLASLKY